MIKTYVVPPLCVCVLDVLDHNYRSVFNSSVCPTVLAVITVPSICDLDARDLTMGLPARIPSPQELSLPVHRLPPSHECECYLVEKLRNEEHFF